MKLLITTTLNRNLTEAKVKPLIALPEVERIFYVSDRPGPAFGKVKYYCVPERLLRFSKDNSIIRLSVKFFIVLYLAIFKRPDLLMGYSFMPHGITVAAIGRLVNIPVCINVIGGALSIQGAGLGHRDNIFLKWMGNKDSLLEKILLKVVSSSRVFTVTGSVTRDFLISKGIDADKITILSSTIDVNRFFPQRSRKKYDLITMAELIPLKRIDVFLRVILRLIKDGLKVKAVILGDGLLRRELEGLSKELGLKDVVSFAGFDPGVERYLNASRVFLLPTQSEGLSLAMLEAMACGVVPVVSRVGNLGDAVKDGINGRLVDRDDLDGYVSAVAGLLRNSDILQSYSENAVKAIHENYTVEDASEKWKKILYDIPHYKKASVWYFNRLKAMSLQEILHRLSCNLRIRLLNLGFLFLGNDRHLSSRPTREAQFFIDREDIDFIKERSLMRKRCRMPAPICAINWEGESVPKIRWQNNFTNDIKRRAGFCNIELKEAWESNRFQWLVGYAQRYALEKEEGLARIIIDILKDWIEKNRPFRGINWSDSLELSLRLISWSWIYFLIKDASAFDRDFEDLFLRDVYFHSHIIEARLSKYSSANNHLIGEAAGLFISGVLFPSLKGADRWLETGKSILEREIERQVYPDGVSKEQSVHYHRFVIELYVIALTLGKKNGISFSRGTISRLEKMCEFLRCMMDEEGGLLPIGDSDGGCAINLNVFEDTPAAVSILIPPII